MNNDGVNKGRRRFLVAATSVVGGAGAVGVAVPFLGSWQPSAKAKAAGAPVKVNIGKLDSGQQIVVEWRGKPVFVVRRSAEMMAALDKVADRLRDPVSESSNQPAYAKNPARSRADHSDVLVLVGLCTHLGCSPKFLGELTAQPFDEQWQGGYYCPCHGSRFDLAGRVFQGVPAPLNLEVPPYQFLDEDTLIIGVDEENS